MSDYFGALIRSSGLTIGGRAQAPAWRPQSEAGLVEINQEREAPRPALATAAELEVRLEPAAARPVVDEGASRQSHAKPAAAPEPPDRGTPATAAPDYSMKQAPAPREEDSKSAAGQPRHVDPVHAAMRWVASDPEIRIEQAIQSPGTRNAGQMPSTSPAPTAGIDVVSEARIVVSEQTVAAPAGDGRARATRGDAAARVITPATQTLERHNAPPPRPAREVAAAAAAGHEETIEISIGAINLHVEAPAPHTVVQPPSAPRARPAPERRAERSGLARRYLRSF